MRKLQDIFVQLSAATSHTCGVTIDQEIKCWGQMPFDEEFAGKDFMQVSTSSSHTCGLHQTGIVECKSKTVLRMFVSDPDALYSQVECFI